MLLIQDLNEVVEMSGESISLLEVLPGWKCLPTTFMMNGSVLLQPYPTRSLSAGGDYPWIWCCGWWLVWFFFAMNLFQKSPAISISVPMALPTMCSWLTVRCHRPVSGLASNRWNGYSATVRTSEAMSVIRARHGMAWFTGICHRWSPVQNAG